MAMKATIKTSGTQLRVKQGDVVVVDRVAQEPGAKVDFPQILLIENGEDITAGTPHVANASVQAEVIEHFRGEKVRVFKMKRRKKYRRTKGHRSELSRLRITSVSNS